MAPEICEDAMELEAMRSDRSWHPCRVSLSSGVPAALSVAILIKNVAEKYEITSRDEVFSRLRYRSIPLQDGECSNIGEGDMVLAMNKELSKPLFYNAMVDKVLRVKHSKRVYCRCTFEVKWVHLENQLESTILSSNLVMKLSTKGIDSYPVVAEFLSSLKSKGLTSDVEEKTPEADVPGLPEYDLQDFLEKQIDEIGRIVDSSQKTCMDEVLWDHSKDENGMATSSSWHSVHSSTRSQRIKQPNLDVKNMAEDTNFLSPLAARAALASLMHELPSAQECSDDYPTKSNANIHHSLKNVVQSASTNSFFQGLNARLPQDMAEFKGNMVHKQSITGSLHSSELKRKIDFHGPTRLTRSQKGKLDLIDETEEKCDGKNNNANKNVKKLTRSVVKKPTEDHVEEKKNKSNGKSNSAEPPIDGGTKIKRNKGNNMFPPVSSISQNPVSHNLIQETQLDEIELSDVVPIKMETNTMPTCNRSSLSTNGSKGTQQKNHSSSKIPNKDKGKNGPFRNPELRSSPRLRLLQNNGSQK